MFMVALYCIAVWLDVSNVERYIARVNKTTLLRIKYSKQTKIPTINIGHKYEKIIVNNEKAT